MSKKVKAVDIASEEGVKEPETEEPKLEIVEDKPEEVVVEESIKEGTPKSDDEVKRKEIIKEEAETPEPNRKMVTCPDCNKTMYEKNFRYQHIAVCGKVKQPKLRAKPIEEVIKEKRERARSKGEPPKAEEKPQPIEPPPPPAAPTYWELRKQYNNQLKEQKQQLVKRLVSRAF